MHYVMHHVEGGELSANPAPHHLGWRLTPQLEQAVRFAEVQCIT